ncbi:MAG: nucleotidyltransferase [Actinomycetota bacterium]
MSGATRRFFLKVIRDSLHVIEGAGADHLVIGGLATKALLDQPLIEDEDIDVLIRSEDAERLLTRFEAAGYATYRRDESWIYKAARPDVTVDLIFRAGEVIELDDEHLARSTRASLDGVEFPVPAPEDLVVMKAIFDATTRPGRWYGALDVLRKLPIDWIYLAERGAAHAPNRILSLMLYAADDGIAVPEDAISRLSPVATS